MKKVTLLLIATCLFLNTKVFCQGFTLQYTINSNNGKDIEWGDWNNDGYLDLMVIGYDPQSDPPEIFRYTGSGFSSYITLPQTSGISNFDLCDYDRDGDLDYAVHGTYSGEFFRIYKKNGNSYSLAHDFNLPYEFGTIKWINFDNDIYMDIILSGEYGGNYYTKLFKGTGSGFTEVTGLNLPQCGDADFECGDFNEDGYEDFVYSGHHGFQDWRTYVYYNYQGTQFYALTPSVFDAPQKADVECGDFDGDGYTDILLTGYNTTKIYKNQGQYFTYFSTINVGNIYQQADWGDADLDGDLDILIGGRSDGNVYIYKYNNNSYSLYQSITGLIRGDVEWGDYDNDGDLDIAVSGTSSGNYGVKIYRNNVSYYVSNSAPGTPTNLYYSRNGNDVTLHWTTPSDDHTPSASLSYNVYLYNTYVTLIRPMSNVSVNQRNYVADNGNTNFNEYLLENLGTGLTYYWKVQAVDGSFKAGNWASSSFYLSNNKSGSTLEEPLGADERENNEFLSIYPNPSNGNVYIDGIKGQFNIMVADMSGKIIVNSSDMEGKVQVDLSEQAKGIYFLTVESQEEVKTERIILQ